MHPPPNPANHGREAFHLTQPRFDTASTAPAPRLAPARPRATRPRSPGPAPEGSRRALNVVLAVTGLVLAAPLMLMIAVLVKATSRGPVLYTQPRVGLDRRNGGKPRPVSRRADDSGGRPFRIYKFRTMYHAPSTADAEVWASPDDPRVTPLGRVLRQYRLDELPQLVNVLLGDMNLVGPRPEQPQIFRRLRTRIDGYHQRQRVRPGITGWAQINQHYDRSLEDVRRKVALDLEYVAGQSTWADVKILLRTVPVVILRRGAW